MAEPVSRRERPSKPALTRAGVVATAAALVRDEGAARLTMRRLAQRLDTGPASLYVYVRDTAELQTAVLGEFLAAVDLTPAGERGPWDDRLRRVVGSYTAVLREHPSLARVAVVTRPSGPHYLALVETLLALLAEGGMPDDRAAWLVDLLLLVATASAAEHGTRGEEGTEGAADADLAATLRAASATQHPRVAALGEALVSGAPEDRERWFVDLLLAGGMGTPRPDR
ncbi:TetR/AcrR family transcriptional regulator [Actinomycetospora sp. C-140]